MSPEQQHGGKDSGPRHHTKLEELKKGGFTLKTLHVFSVLEDYEHAIIAGHFGFFFFEENANKEIA